MAGQMIKELGGFGDVVEGKSGVSATRLAEYLGVTVAVIRKVAKPCGQMKIPRCSAFDVYRATPAALKKLKAHPEILKGQERKQKRGQKAKEIAAKAAATRRQKCVDILARRHPDLTDLYSVIVYRLWSPSSERSLQDVEFYSDYPAELWNALSPRPAYGGWAVTVIANIMWACTKQRTWKVNECGDQDEPLALSLYGTNYEEHPILWQNMFAASIRHAFYERLPKGKGRERALKDLSKKSKRRWSTHVD